MQAIYPLEFFGDCLAQGKQTDRRRVLCKSVPCRLAGSLDNMRWRGEVRFAEIETHAVVRPGSEIGNFPNAALGHFGDGPGKRFHRGFLQNC